MDWVGGAATGSVWGWVVSGLLRRSFRATPRRRVPDVAAVLLAAGLAVAVAGWLAGRRSATAAGAALAVGLVVERAWHGWLRRPSHPLNRSRAT